MSGAISKDIAPSKLVMHMKLSTTLLGLCIPLATMIFSCNLNISLNQNYKNIVLGSLSTWTTR